MMWRLKTPLAMGCAMGAMMIFMMHDWMTDQGSHIGSAALLFIAAHIAIAAIALAIAAFGLSHFPRVAAFAKNLHRPNAHHFGAILSATLATMLVIHLIHGGP